MFEDHFILELESAQAQTTLSYLTRRLNEDLFFLLWETVELVGFKIG